MRKEVCEFSESYTREELWYHEETGEFSIDQYHFGVIDDEEHFDGVKEIDPFSALKKMIKYNHLSAILQYSQELHLSRDLEAALAEMQPRSAIYDYAFMADRRFTYYRLTEDEHAVYYMGTFFSVKNSGLCAADFSVVRRILETDCTVVRYDPLKKEWRYSKVSEALYL